MSARARGIAAGLLALAVAITPAERASGQGRGPVRPEVGGVVKAVDTGAGTITIAVVQRQEGRDTRERRDPVTTDKTYTLAKDVEVATGVGFGRGGTGLFRE